MEKTRIIKTINQVNEHIKIPHDDKIADCCDAATGTSGCRFAQGSEIRWKRLRVLRTKVQLFDPGIHMRLVSTLSLTVDRMYTTQMMTRCKSSLSAVDGHALCGCDNSQVGTWQNVHNDQKIRSSSDVDEQKPSRPTMRWSSTV